MAEINLNTQMNLVQKLKEPKASALSKGSPQSLSQSESSKAQPKEKKQDDNSSFANVLSQKNAPEKPVNPSKVKIESSAPQATNQGVEAPVKEKPSEFSKNENKQEVITESEAKEKIMNLFLQKMQSELGIQPDDFIDAYAQLDEADLALPAEETIEKVIGNLDLDESQRKVAEGLYAEMLVLSAAVNMSHYLKHAEKTANVEVLTPEQAAKKQTQKNISALSDEFFANSAQKPKEMATVQKAQGFSTYGKAVNAEKSVISAEVEAPLSQKIGPNDFFVSPQTDRNKIDASQSDIGKSGLNTANTDKVNSIDPQALGLENIEPTQLDPNDPIQKLQKQLNEMSIQAPDSFDASSLDASGALEAKSGPTAGQGKLNEAILFNQKATSSLTAQGLTANSASSGTDFGTSSDSQSESFEQGSSPVTPINKADDQKINKTDVTQFQVTAPKASTAEVQNNIQELISQAQFLAKKGGGEMKVQMSPEGMGNINLKVAIVEGQVNVEMVASNSEAKKILEKGIDELKSNLALQKINVDQIKIDSSSEASNQMNRQPGQESADRQFQQKFLQDFRDNNSGFRREFVDFGMPRVPGSQMRDRDSSTTYDPTARKKAAARRLDLVA